MASSIKQTYSYLHGFASGPKSGKAVLLQQYLASCSPPRHLQIPDLNIPSFQQLCVSAILDDLTYSLSQSTQPHRLIGSSLGGYIAVSLARTLQDANAVDSLLLLCPALDAAKRWSSRMSESDLAEWKKQGSKSYYNFNSASQQPLHYEFYSDLQQQPAYPIVHCPVTIIHGSNDDVVPIDISRQYIKLLQEAGNTKVQLIEVEDDHSLMKNETIEIIKDTISKQWLTEQ